MILTARYGSPEALEALQQRVKELNGMHIDAGWSGPLGASPETVKIAAINTFGAPRASIPARDVLTPLAVRSRGWISKVNREVMRKLTMGEDYESDVEGIARRLEMEGKQAVRDFASPANAPSTIAGKGFDDPLVGKGADGGRLVREFAAAVFRDID